MRHILHLVLFVGLLLISCRRDDSSTGIPTCLQHQIELIKAERVWNPPARIYQYRYQGRTVYFIPQRCCDIPSRLLDETCTQICLPDGGFTGAGDGRCTDFVKTRTDEKLIWEDTRK